MAKVREATDADLRNVVAANDMTAILEKLRRALESVPGWRDYESVAVAFSGGLDSTVLLAALKRLALGARVRALHVDHGLNPKSRSWASHCRDVAAELGVEYASREALVSPEGASGPEAAAREARYAALRDMLAARELLVTAHHRDDQLETVLLRLVRGSGVRGLRGIDRYANLDGMPLARPLLQVPREDLRALGERWGLRWIDDPSNADTRFDRNYLRSEIVPRLRARWPGVAATVSRAAAQMRAAQEILDDVAVADTEGIGSPERASIAAIRDLSPARQGNLLRHLIRCAGLPGPTAAQLGELQRALEVERPDAETQVVWPGAEARLYRGTLYLFRPMNPGSGAGYEGRLDVNSLWCGPEGLVKLVPTSGAGLPDSWAEQGFTVRFRAGGERFRPLNEAHTRSLKKWFQSEGIVPWMRARIPLLYRDSTLVAVGDLALSDAVRDTGADGPAWTVHWSDHPPLT